MALTLHEGTRSKEGRGNMVNMSEEKSQHRYGGKILEEARGNMVINGTRAHGQKMDEGTW